jgi:hypothetical protein
MSTARRMDRARDNGAITRIENGHRKRKERASRDKRMAELVKNGTFPYTPAVMNWVSLKLGKPASQVKPDEVKALVK